MSKRFILAILVIATLCGLAFADSTPPPAPTPSKSNNSGGATAPRAPTSASDFYAAGYKATKQGGFQDAIADFQKAITLKPDYAEAYNMLGFCQRTMGDTKDAFANYEIALSLKPNFPEAREYYGETFLAVDDLKDALRQYIIIQKSAKGTAKELLDKIEEYLAAHPGA